MQAFYNAVSEASSIGSPEPLISFLGRDGMESSSDEPNEWHMSCHRAHAIHQVSYASD